MDGEIPSGKTNIAMDSYGKSPFLMGKSTFGGNWYYCTICTGHLRFFARLSICCYADYVILLAHAMSSQLAAWRGERIIGWTMPMNKGSATCSGCTSNMLQWTPLNLPSPETGSKIKQPHQRNQHQPNRIKKPWQIPITDVYWSGVELNTRYTSSQYQTKSTRARKTSIKVNFKLGLGHRRPQDVGMP